MNKKVVIVYHADLDGICSAAVAKKALELYYPEIEMVEFNWSKGDVKEFECNTLYILDCVLPKERLKKEIENLGRLNVVWIDHHKSTIEKYKEFENLPGIRDPNAPGACTLTWNHFFDSEKIPPIVYHIGDRDIWRYESIKTKPVCEYMFYVSINPNDWDIYINMEDIEEIYEKGKLLLNARLSNIRATATRAYTNIFHGQKTVAINYNDRISKPDMGEYLLRKVKEAEVAFIYHYFKEKDKYFLQISLYSKGNVDVSEIARKYGGGGHKGAAGFVMEVKF